MLEKVKRSEIRHKAVFRLGGAGLSDVRQIFFREFPVYRLFHNRLQVKMKTPFMEQGVFIIDLSI
jgi:hypothetical protein